ncbi:hypothetical protein N665_0984s0001 [Sinapis alba]|nr:hypothetical protein N665_0984s0001 [Sinapis alba]
MLTWNTSVNSSFWTQLMSGLLGSCFTTVWEEIILLTIHNTQDMLTKFFTSYGFQVSLHSLWRERNGKLHGATLTTVSALVSMLDRHIRNRCSSIRELGDHRYTTSLGVWLVTQ